ncbi:MAG: precorrin-6y C5,15-methyltransferase (decarboxylating) subunit CbiE [Rhodospirillales bacterium]
MNGWLTVVGLGEEGLEGLGSEARGLVDEAELLVGGERHLSKVSEGTAERIDWRNGFDEAFDAIAKNEGRRVVVLASGDPMHYGVGAQLVRRFGPEAMRVIPQPSAFSLAAARLGWPLARVQCLTVHARPLEQVALYLVPGRRLLLLSRDGETPDKLAGYLKERGFGPSPMTVLANMGGETESRLDGTAGNWPHGRASDLNVIAVECRAADGARVLSRVPGLPEDAFEHDGVITKREVRSATLARLMPLPGQVLWDVGAGTGAVAIEWLRAEPSGTAVAVERDPARAAVIARNAANLGVPSLTIVEGEAPAALEGIEGTPDAVFIGGGTSRPGLLEACWEAVRSGGRLVANAVTIEAQARLFAFRAEHGGDLIRIGVSRVQPVGQLHGFQQLMDVTQLALVRE